MKLKIKHNKIQCKTERIKKNLPRNRLNNTFTIDKISILSIYVEMNIIMNKCLNYRRDNHLR